ncbi:MAG: alcohol dehydrogenase [Pseudonocardiales bacterium]|nr:MAG: alcohol dehydrogenase [Pseudonocardiales bacterium]
MTHATAAITRAEGQPFVLEDIDVDQPRADEVLVRIVASGVCHTDVNCRNQVYDIELPIVLGHEGSGVIEAVGSQVSSAAVGDHVVLSYGTCGVCPTCRSGHSAYCPQVYPLNLVGNRPDGSSSLSGGVRSHFFGQSSFATHAVVPERNVVAVSKDAPLALLGPLGCGIQTGAGAVLLSLQVRAGESLVVFGAGAVGLSAVMAGVIAGAYPIIAVDLSASRLKKATELGATYVIDATEQDPVAAVRELTHGGARYAIEATGSPAAFSQAVQSLGSRGVCGLVGAVGAGVNGSFDWLHVQMSGITIRGVIEGDAIPQDFIPQLISYHQRGRFPFDRLITEYDFADINTAVADAEAGVAIKPVLRIGSVS